MMFEAVSFNSVSSIPGLMMIIGLLSFYEIRKNFSRAYRIFSFFVLYWVQIVMICKLAVEILLKVESINARIHMHKDSELKVQVTILQILFGRLHTTEEIRSGSISYTSYYWLLTTIMCIYCAQGWKSCKWLEIRDKTPDLRRVHHSSIRFWKYIKVREQEDKDELRLV